MTIFSDIKAVLASLGVIDYILYFSVLALIILMTCLVYVIKNEEDMTGEVKKEEEENNDMNNELDLQAIVNKIEDTPKPQIDMTSYEQEQEQKAIISYDELLKEARGQELNYEKEELVDDCIPTKKIDLSNIIYEQSSKPYIKAEDKHSPLFHYEQEEAFLNALKELNEMLN